MHQRASGAIDNSPATSSSSSSSGAPGTSSGGSGSSGSGGGYTSAPGGCSSFTSSKDAVTASLTLFEKTTKSIVMPGLVLPVDVAMSPTSGRIAVAAAGNGHATGTSSLFAVDAAKIPDGASGCVSDSSLRHLEGQLTSVAWVDDDTLLAFSREPAVLYFVPSNESVDVTALKLSNASREDTGHAVFHSNTGAGIACASCHAEGGEDGLVWTFSEQGRRRTPSLKGTLAGTAPYHWSGDLSDTPALVHKVYEEGMAGPALVPDQVDALRGWLFAVPRPANLVALDTVSADRGRGLFEGSAGCSTCHSGARLTNNATVDVGTGGAFQVPSLIGVAHRAPYLHDGCAATLEDRFGKCGGGTAHGNVAVLGATDIADLVSYLKTL